jgi:serine/threonine protein kinase/Tfp pilus assembly protein PilF
MEEMAREMIGKSISHYRIIEKIGQGGMGEVYLAEDTKLNRKVALKFLPPQYVSDQDLKTRFKREAQAAAALNHPNIITIHEVSEYEGRPYMAMEYVEGGSLRDLIGADKMSVAQVTNLAAQISEGLAKAHQAGIVHRDIKPQNILIDADGRPRICDFGLAKLRREVVLTQTGTTLGTIAYMSPEQARGEEVDHRADIWSLGVVVYEMLTGQRPFRGDHDQAVIYAILNSQPESISGIRPDAPGALVRIIDKAMAKSPDDRYRDMAEMVSQLRSLKAELDSQLTKTVEAEKRMSPSIAVLPFANLSADKEQEYFCDGMAEDIINALTQVEGLHVVARTSAFAFKGKSQDIRKIGKELSVSWVLEGSVRKASNRVRITAQLINVADGYHIWSEKFDRDLADVFAIQDEISLAIVEKLKVKLLGNEKQKMLKRYTQNLEAYDLYLKGRYHWNRRTSQSLKKAVAHFEQVIEKDPDYALAYTGLADCYSMLEQVQVITAKEAFPKARELAKKALEIDETLAEAHTSLAFVLECYDWDWIGMEREFRRAIELNPNYATAHQWFAMALVGLMRTSEAIQEINRALELDPLSLIINTAAGFVYIHSGQEEKAVRQAERILDMDPSFGFAHLIVASVKERHGEFDEAVEAYLKVENFAGLLSQQEIASLRGAFASSGWAGYLRKRLEMELPKVEDGKVRCYDIAWMYARLDETEKTIEWLERAYEERDKGLTGLLMDDAFKKLQPDPRFREIIKKMGLPK